MPTLPLILGYDCIIPSFTHSPHSADAVLQFSHTHSIRRAHFGCFCSITAFDGRSLAAFPLRILPRCPCPPFSRTITFLLLSLTLSIQRSHFGRFCTISAFDGRVLAAFSLSAFSHPTPAPRSRIRSHFFSFRSLAAFNGRILAGFAQSLHLTVAFWQLFLSPQSSTPHLSPVLLYDRIFAAFAHSQHSTVAFWQVLPNLCIRRSRFGRFCTISAFDGRVLAPFPLSSFSHPAPAPPFSLTIGFLQL